MFGTIAKKVDGGQGDAVGGLVDGDHLVFGTIAKKVDGGHGDAVGGLVVVREGRRRGRVSSHPMGHHYSCHTSLFKSNHCFQKSS